MDEEYKQSDISKRGSKDLWMKKAFTFGEAVKQAMAEGYERWWPDDCNSKICTRWRRRFFNATSTWFR